MISAGESKNRGSRAVQAVDLHISEEHGSHSITRDFWRYMPATWESLKNENKEKQGRKAKTQQNSHHPIIWCEIRTTHPPCANSLLWPIFKSMLSVPTQNLSAKRHRNANLVRNCLYDYFSKNMLSVSKNHRNAKISHFTIPCAKFAFLFKSHFLFFKSKLVLLQFSQHLSSDHPFPSTRSSPSSSPIPNPTMAAHLKSFIP